MTTPLTPRSAYSRQEMDRIGPETTEAEADEMRVLLIDAGYTDAHDVSERNWNRLLAAVSAQTVECLYCSADVADAGEYVPAVDDDEAWGALTAEHTDDCEWVATRAHRMVQS